VLFIKKGKLRVDFYSGDVILFIEGGQRSEDRGQRTVVTPVEFPCGNPIQRGKEV
jgi:hypothetical protein